ncbi:MAG: DUF4123 domain-containing protein [Gammaproteobacteria bacterium]
MAIDAQTARNLQQKLLRQLFADAKLSAYAVLDGASNPALLDHLYGEDRPEFACLYRGELEADIAECAPYLARLEADSPFTDWLTGKSWGLHWGIYALADCDLKTLRSHLRRMNMVYEPETHKPLLFRYYDPRVLTSFLPACDAKQGAEFFGPVQEWFAEGKNGNAITRFARNEQRVVTDEI